MWVCFQVIEELIERCENLSEIERFVTLMHDEMTIKEDLVSSVTLFSPHPDGFMDFPTLHPQIFIFHELA